MRREIFPTGGRRTLTPREAQIVQLRLDGLSNTEIADRLGITYRAVSHMLTTASYRYSHINRADMLEDFAVNGIPGYPVAQETRDNEHAAAR